MIPASNHARDVSSKTVTSSSNTSPASASVRRSMVISCMAVIYPGWKSWLPEDFDDSQQRILFLVRVFECETAALCRRRGRSRRRSFGRPFHRDRLQLIEIVDHQD